MKASLKAKNTKKSKPDSEVMKALTSLVESAKYLDPPDQKRTLWVSPKLFGPISEWVKAKKIKNVTIICPACIARTEKKKK